MSKVIKSATYVIYNAHKDKSLVAGQSQDSQYGIAQQSAWGWGLLVFSLGEGKGLSVLVFLLCFWIVLYYIQVA